MKLAILLNYSLICKTFILYWSFKVLHSKGPKSSGRFYKKQVPETLLGVHSQLSSLFPSIWPLSLHLLALPPSPPQPKPFSEVPHSDIVRGCKKEETQMDLQRPVQGTCLKNKSAVSRYFRRSFSFSVCSPDGFYHSLPVCILRDGLHFLLSQALSPRMVV